MLIDSHCHPDGLSLAEGGVAGSLERARAAGIRRIMLIGGSAAENERVLGIAGAAGEMAGAACGYDRDCAGRENDIEKLALILAEGAACAVGECGLDYHYRTAAPGEQRKLFAAMLELAAGARLPVIVHTREAEADTLRVLRKHSAQWRGDQERIGVVHCFTGSKKFAAELLDLGFYIGISGILTFRNARSLRDIAAGLPLERLLVETDAPYLAPEPRRGGRNEPSMVAYVAAALARLKNVEQDDARRRTAINACRLFGWEDLQ